jgi:putrescine---pyruvate transaminase
MSSSEAAGKQSRYVSVQRTTQDWQALDRAHYLHPFTDHAALHAKGTRVITHAKGVYLYDSDGRRLLDGMAGLWCVTLGYGRTELADVARAQLLELPFYNSFFQSAHPPAIELSGLLAQISPPQFKHVFLTGSGSEANDTVVRMVRRYWDLLGEPQRSVIISRHNAYHGSTMAGASLGGMGGMHAQGGLPIPGIEHIRQPYWYAEGGEQSPEEFGLLAARALEQKILQVGAERVGAFIGEPIQGAGGVIIPPASYWPEIQRIVDKYGLLLVADEVICGFGRTGEWFGSDYFGIRPDLMPVAKGMSSGYLPIGGVMIGDRVADVLIARGGEFYHGFTYSGHPVSCAVACETLRIMRRERLVEQVKAVTAPYLTKQWATLADHPLVGEARNAGLMGALELVRDKRTRRPFAEPGTVGTICRDICFENGLVMRAVRDAMIIAPPLVISAAEIDELVNTARHCLDLTLAEIKRRSLL